MIKQRNEKQSNELKKNERMKSKSEEETKYNKLLLIMIRQTESVMSSQRFNNFYRISEMRSFHFDSVSFIHLHPFVASAQSRSHTHTHTEQNVSMRRVARLLGLGCARR